MRLRYFTVIRLFWQTAEKELFSGLLGPPDWTGRRSGGLCPPLRPLPSAEKVSFIDFFSGLPDVALS